MLKPKVNGGISGPLNYDTELTKALEKLKKEAEERYPIEIEIQMHNTTDKKWQTWKNYDGKEKTEKV